MVQGVDTPPFWGPGFLTTASFLAAYLFATAFYSRRQLSVNRNLSSSRETQGDLP